MKKVIVMLLVLALGLASVSLAAEGIWTTKADMPTGRWDLSTCVVDGKIYAIGGASRYRGTPLSTVEEYDPATDTWTMKSEMPTARQGLSTSVVDGKIYAIGGIDLPSAKNFSTVEEYDPATDTWTTKSEMPTARAFHSANAVDGRIYVIGGARSSPGSGTILMLEVYDPATDSWTRKGDIPRPISTASTSIVDGKIYAIGGEGTGRRVDEYDPVTDTWTRKADMPSSRTDLSGSVVDGKIYVMGGDGAGTVIVATVEVYDPATDTWTTAPDMPIARTALRTTVVDGKIYAIGGLTGWGAAACVTVEEYDPNPLVVDFNGDGIVDSSDMCIMIDHWHTDEPLYDISPRPFGDGIVDVQDLIVLAEYLFTYPGAVAYWKLDEAEGIIAHDSAGINDAVTFGGPLWQPVGGQVDGAIQLDGIDDFVVIGSIPNPTEGPFSVLAWIKGGAPGQVVLSQIGGVNWLCTDPLEGNLMTELKGTGRGAAELLSQTIITDDNWHQIGLVWDGAYRMLYVDGAAVAEDTQTNLEGSYNGLYIGAGKALDADSFFSGLIDDIRIYNRAVSP